MNYRWDPNRRYSNLNRYLFQTSLLLLAHYYCCCYGCCSNSVDHDKLYPVMTQSNHFEISLSYLMSLNLIVQPGKNIKCKLMPNTKRTTNSFPPVYHFSVWWLTTGCTIEVLSLRLSRYIEYNIAPRPNFKLLGRKQQRKRSTRIALW